LVQNGFAGDGFQKIRVILTANLLCLKFMELLNSVILQRVCDDGDDCSTGREFLNVGKEIIDHAVQTAATEAARGVGCHESRTRAT
jgi:hypothetical protein